VQGALRTPISGKRDPILAAVGQLQLGGGVQYRLQRRIRRENPLEPLGFSPGSLGNRWLGALEVVGRLSQLQDVRMPGGRPVLCSKNSWNLNQLNEEPPRTRPQCRAASGGQRWSSRSPSEDRSAL